MPLAPQQLAIATVELLLLLGGVVFCARILSSPESRARLWQITRLPPWNVSGFEVGLLAMLWLLFAMLGQGLTLHYFGPAIRASSNRAALEVAVYGLGFHGGALLAWPIFYLLRGRIHADYGAEPPPLTPSPRLPLGNLIARAGVTFIVALPCLGLASYAWNLVLRGLGIPDEPQNLIEIFRSTESLMLLGAMLFVACVLAPLNEELFFRGVMFRFGRQRFHRWGAMVVSSLLFGALHMNWASFLPLALLGSILCLSYERNGDLRVPILAHALFNLNTIILVVSGVVTT